MRSNRARVVVVALCSLGLMLAASTAFASPKPKLTMAEAKKIALAKHDGKIKSAELETENGVQQYSFDIKTDKGLFEVGVNANDGSIVEDKMESPKDEAAEKSADAAAAKAKKK